MVTYDYFSFSFGVRLHKIIVSLYITISYLVYNFLFRLLKIVVYPICKRQDPVKKVVKVKSNKRYNNWSKHNISEAKLICK